MRITSHWLFAAVVCAAIASQGRAQTVPPGFTNTTIATGLVNATSMTVTPDGRILIAKKSGEVRTWKDGVLLASAMHVFLVREGGESGLVGITVDPDFLNNRYVYAYMQTLQNPPNNPLTSRDKLKRFTVASGLDLSIPGSEIDLFDFGPGNAGVHHGGEVQFGSDGKVYVAVGDHGTNANSQNMNNLLGKISRLNPDGSIPEDNPFYGTNTDSRPHPGASRATSSSAAPFMNRRF